VGTVKLGSEASLLAGTLYQGNHGNTSSGISHQLRDVYSKCRGCRKTGATNETGTAHPLGAPEFTPVLSGMRLVRYLVFCVLFYRSLFVLLAVMFSVVYIFISLDNLIKYSYFCIFFFWSL
jgi:hypothetical protein